MDNLTHSLCGWTLARAGVSRLGGWVTPAIIVAANAPDIDCVITSDGIFAGPWGPNTELMLHHHGLMHSLIGAGALALALGIVVWAIGRIFKLHDRPALWATLLVSALGALSHVLLDWFNTYGIRPWLPWDGTWYYGDMAFIVDPWMWLLLGAAVFLGGRHSRGVRRLWLFLGAMTTSMMILAARQGYISWVAVAVWFVAVLSVAALRGIVFTAQAPHTPARAGLLLWTVYVCLLFLCSRAATVRAVDYLTARDGQRQPMKLSANPFPAVPWRYHILAQTERAVETIDVDLLRDRVVAEKRKDVNLRDPLLAQIQDTPEYHTWALFARHPVWEREEGGIIKLGDMRYRLEQRRDWSEMSVPVAPRKMPAPESNAPTPQ